MDPGWLTTALILTGESGAGKSTLAALLGERGWRLMGDEFALLDLETGALLPFPRAVSLKNGAIRVIGRVGYDCACAIAIVHAKTAAIAAERMVSIVASS